MMNKNPPPQVYTAKRCGPHAKRDKPSFIKEENEICVFLFYYSPS